MNLLCSAIETLWNNFYNTCFRNLDFSASVTIGLALLLASLICFIHSTKGKKKGDLINNWLWFWISMILFIIGVLYLSS